MTRVCTHTFGAAQHEDGMVLSTEAPATGRSFDLLPLLQYAVVNRSRKAQSRTSTAQERLGWTGHKGFVGFETTTGLGCIESSIARP